MCKRRLKHKLDDYMHDVLLKDDPTDVEDMEIKK